MSFVDATNPRFPLISVVVPRDLDFSDHAASFGVEMALIHNVFIRGLNSMHHHAPLVKPGDAVAFSGYALAWVKTLHDHHHGEETILFPFFQTKFDMEHNVSQHKEFLTQLAVFESYLKKVFSKKDVYEGEKTRELLEAFGDTLVEHLHQEIPTISPERLAQFDKKDLDAAITVHSNHIKAQPITTAHVMVITHHDFKAVPSWPPMPGPVVFIIRKVAYWRHYSYWRFSPFTRYGESQTYDT